MEQDLLIISTHISMLLLGVFIGYWRGKISFVCEYSCESKGHKWGKWEEWKHITEVNNEKGYSRYTRKKKRYCKVCNLPDDGGAV